MPLSLAPAAVPSAEPPAAAVYRARRDHYAAERSAEARRWSLVANGRLAAMAAALGLIVWSVLTQSAPILVASVVPVAAFAVLVVIHGRQEQRRRRLVLLERLNEEAERRVLRRWSDLPVYHQTRSPAGHAYASDLDLFGRASLFHLLDVVGGTLAEPTLASWLLSPASLASARRRQEAVRELAPQIDLRETFSLLARSAAEARPSLDPLLAWAEGPSWLAGRAWLVATSRVAATTLWLAFAAHVLGLVGWPIWLPFLGLTLLIAATSGRDAHRIVAAVRDTAEPLRWYAAAFAASTSAGFRAPLLSDLTGVLTDSGLPAHREVARLYRIGNAAIPRSAMLYGVVQALTLWDVHVLAMLEGWQQRCGRRLRGWLAAQAEIEALAALAGLAHDNPNWVFPDLRDDADEVLGRAVGHPLIPDAVRVSNDVRVGPPGTFLLVTGSNMSGKSTYLRALGLNVVLALAGAPVCAQSLSLPALDVWTSMRVQDSLEEGVSFFMAELGRIKQIVDAVDAANA
ncbi:MAG: hypothetical protein KatS3mg060_3081 [Dehalococcoidia bacterium]|nr:MAG: hypothetical protein KatS3mg060_3081 [Dehalococcoidia bacterium]